MKLNNKGLSLLDVLIGGALMFGANVGLMKFVENQVSRTKKTENLTRVKLLREEVENFLGKSSTCTRNFQNLNPASSTSKVNLLKDDGSVGPYVVGNKYVEDKIELTSLRFGGWTQSHPEPDKVITGLELQIIIPDLGNKTQTVTQKVNIQAELNGSNEVIDCIAVTGSANTIWQPAVGAEIYHEKKFTGIGTSSPSSVLEVYQEDPNIGHIYFQGHENSRGSTYDIEFYRARGTTLSPSTVQKDDKIGAIQGYGFDGSEYRLGGSISLIAKENYSPDNTAYGFTFGVNPGLGTAREEQIPALIISDDKFAIFPSKDPNDMFNSVSDILPSGVIAQIGDNDLYIKDDSIGLGAEPEFGKLLEVHSYDENIKDMAMIEYSSPSSSAYEAAGEFEVIRARGTPSSPSTQIRGDKVGGFRTMDWSGSNFRYNGAFYSYASSNHNSSNSGAHFMFVNRHLDDGSQDNVSFYIRHDGLVGIGDFGRLSHLPGGTDYGNASPATEKGRTYRFINNTSPAIPNTTRLRVYGELKATSALTVLSDKRLKTGVERIVNALDDILKLRPVRFKWKDKDRQLNREYFYGLVAQEVEEVFPDFVRDNGEEFKSVYYSRFYPVLVEAVKELDQKFEELAAQEAELEAQIDKLLKESSDR